jgi:hypothetical protein
MELVARFANRHHLWRREKKQVSIRAQHAAPTPMPVHVLATACHALLCPHLSMATCGPRCHLPSPRVLHSSVLWTWRHRNLFVTLPLGKGRPSTPAAKQAARTKKRLAAQGAALFKHRHLFVQRHLHTTERKTLWRVSRGLPQLQALRALMEQVYTLFDRRCRTQTALDKLTKLRHRLNRCKHLGETLKKLFSPTLEKALTFLDDKLLPSTSNAVERGNRRYRKMQKSIYSVRTQEQIKARIALDRWREAQGEGRDQTLQALHKARAG